MNKWQKAKPEEGPLRELIGNLKKLQGLLRAKAAEDRAKAEVVKKLAGKRNG